MTVGVLQVLDTLLIPRVLSHLSGGRPGIVVRVKRLWHREIEAAVEGGEIDLGLCFAPPRTHEMEMEVLSEVEMTLIVPEGHPLAARPSLRLQDIEKEAMILLPQKGSWVRKLTDKAFDEVKLRPKCAVEFDSVDAILATIRQGLGVGFLPIEVLGKGRPGVAAIKLDGPPMKVGLGLLWRRGAERSRALAAFAESTRSVIHAEGLTPMG